MTLRSGEGEAARRRGPGGSDRVARCAATACASAADCAGQFKLTPRQTDVLALLLRGQSNKLIARELNLSVETVKDHVAAVLRALGVNSRTQAVLAVSQMPGQGGIAPWPPRPFELSAAGRADGRHRRGRRPPASPRAEAPARRLRAAARPGPRHLRLQPHLARRPHRRRRPDRR